METFKKYKIVLSKSTTDEIQKVLTYRNVKSLVYEEDEKTRNIEDFILGSTMRCLHDLQKQQRIAGIEQLSKPFELKNRIREYAVERGITQKIISDATGIHTSVINNTWNNKGQPSLDYFFRIWFVLGCPPFEKLLYREEE